jgi:hypothetical protein
MSLLGVSKRAFLNPLIKQWIEAVYRGLKVVSLGQELKNYLEGGKR